MLKIYWILLLSVFIAALFVYFYKSAYSYSKNSVQICFAGDVMLGRLVNEKISATSYEYPWGNLLPYLLKSDLNIINLEATLTKSTKVVPKIFNFKADPDKVRTLKKARIDIVSIANNHILDFDIEGLQETISVLDNAQVLHVGAGNNMEEATKPVIVERNGVKIGVIGYTDNEPIWKAGFDKPGTNYIKVGDIEKIKSDIEHVRPSVDILILSVHWGPNMRQVPSAEFIDFAHQIIDSGVDIIHGHSAHIVQGLEGL